MNSERHLGKLLMDSKGGCSGFYPSGIGDILSVKDIPTGTVVTRNFRCSKFGGFSGWVIIFNLGITRKFENI